MQMPRGDDASEQEAEKKREGGGEGGEKGANCRGGMREKGLKRGRIQNRDAGVYR